MITDGVAGRPGAVRTGVPRFTVVVVSAGDARRAVDSVRRQSVPPVQMLLVTRFGPAYRMPGAGQLPLTPAQARAAVATAATGDYIAFLAGHCAALPGWLSAVAANTARAPVIHTGCLRVGSDGLVTDIWLPDPTRPGRDPGRWVAAAGAVAVHRDVLVPPGPGPANGRSGRAPVDVAALPQPLIRAGPAPTDRVEAGRELVPLLGKILPAGRAVAAIPPPAQVAGVAPGRARQRPTLVSVVLPVRNSAATLPAQLAALAAQTYPDAWELVVVDNGSTDGSAGLVAEFPGRPKARVVTVSTVAGEAYARNAGVAAAAGDFLAFCDGDDVAAPTWLAGLVEAARHADLVGGALEVRRLSPAAVDEQPLPMTAQTDFLPFARSANCGVWRDVLVEIGGWQAGFRGGGEDMDLSWRAQLCGFRLGYAPAALMHYRLRAGLAALAGQKWRYGRSGAQLYRSYRNAGMLRRDWRQVLRSWLWLWLHLPDLRSPRIRRRWVRYAARLAGFAYGSIRQRVAYL